MERNVKLLKTVGSYLGRCDVGNGMAMGAMLLSAVSYLRVGDFSMGGVLMAITLFLVVRYSIKAEKKPEGATVRATRRRGHPGQLA